MQVLTPSGYVDVSTLQPGDLVSAFDVDTGAPITNSIENIEFVDVSEWQRWWKPMVDSGELADYPSFAFYKINGTWTLNSEQSIWRNGTNVCHVRDLVVGDTVYDDSDHDVIVISVELLTTDGWYRFDISGDHSYIADGLTLHNASRFWVTGTGTWDSSTTTHWSASSGGAGSQSVPGSADTVTFDGSSGGGTVTLNFGGTITIQSLTNGAFTGTWDNSVNNNNMTLSASGGYSGSGAGTRTVKLGSATYSLTGTANNIIIFTFSTTTGLTFDAGTSTIDFAGVVPAGIGQAAVLGNLTWSTLKISGSRFSSGLAMTPSSGCVIGTLNITTTASVSILTSAPTITTLTVTTNPVTLVFPNATTTITNAPTLSGTSSNLITILNNSTSATATSSTITCSSGSFTGTYVACQGLTFSGTSLPTFTSSYDLGKNNNATITAPSAGGPVAQFISHQRGTPY